jgi:hypothetical protein
LAQLARNDDFALRIDGVELKHAIRQISRTRVTPWKFRMDLPWTAPFS